MCIEELMEKINLDAICKSDLESLKKSKFCLSNKEKKELIKVLARAKRESKETILKTIVCYAIFCPDEAIENARRKGIFRYKVCGLKDRNFAKYYLSFFVKHMSLFGFSSTTCTYLCQKNACDWLGEFYNYADTKIDLVMEAHHKKRIRKRIHDQNYESALWKELLAYVDMTFLLEGQRRVDADFDTLRSFSQEEVAEGVSYLVFKYIEKYGISQSKNYIVDACFVQSKEIEQLILIACQVNYVLELELLVDYFDYDIFLKENQIILRSRDDSFEKSIRLAYIKQEMQEILFYDKRAKSEEEALYLSQISELTLEYLEENIVQKIKDGICSRYVFTIPYEILEKVGEQNTDGKIQLYAEEALEIEFFAKEMCMTINELYEKKITEHCNVYDIVLCQRFFRFLFYTQKMVYKKEKNCRIILQSLIPLTKKEVLLQLFEIPLKNLQKAKEVFELLKYDSKFKFDLQYTPLICIGEKKVIYPMSVFAHSNLIRNTIAYSYLSQNKFVNDDKGLEPLVKLCKSCFEQCKYDYSVFSNKKYKYKGRKGELDVLVVSDEDIIIIECKEPLMPTNNFEMRATFEHIEKASKQLDFAKEAFEDDGFRNQFFKDSLKINGKRRTVRTCIVLGNRLFSAWSGSKHPIRYIYELDMVLNRGQINSNFAKWSIWKGEVYSHDDLTDFLDNKGLFISIMQKSMDKYHNSMSFKEKTLLYESYMLNTEKFWLICDEKLRVLEKDVEMWDRFREQCGDSTELIGNEDNLTPRVQMQL